MTIDYIKCSLLHVTYLNTTNPTATPKATTHIPMSKVGQLREKKITSV